jgi:hypothetical protein
MMELREEIGLHEIILCYQLTGRGLIVSLTGGESPHVGGVALSSPRQSLSGEDLSCDSCVIPLPGHKNHIVGQKIAETLCKATGQPVALTAGIHIDNAMGEEIKLISGNCQVLASRLLEIIEAQTPPPA